MSAPSDGARGDARKRLAAADSSQSAVAFIRALVGAWDCCGTCAGGVLATRDRELIADAKAEAWDEACEHDISVCCGSGCEYNPYRSTMPVVLNPSAIGDANQTPIVRLPVEQDAPLWCPTCHGHGWIGARHGDHCHCDCGAPCGVDRSEGCTGGTRS